MQTSTALPLEYAAAVVHKLLTGAVPALSWLLPINAFMAIAKGASAVMTHEIMVDGKDVTFDKIAEAGMQLFEAAVYRNAKEIKEAVYAVMVIFTNIEDFMSMDVFVSGARGDEMLPTANITPESVKASA